MRPLSSCWSPSPGWPGVLEQLRALNPDVIVLNEAGPDGPAQREFLRAAFPGYEVSGVRHGLVVIARGTVQESGGGLLGPNGRYEHRRVEVRGLAVDILQPEIRSNPLWSRAEGPAEPARVVGGLADGPTLVMGDLKTPHDSRHLARLREAFDSAFETAGWGHHATWPVLCPVLAIDHVWVGRGLRAVSCRLVWTWRSDHLPVVVDVVPAGSPPATSADDG